MGVVIPIYFSVGAVYFFVFFLDWGLGWWLEGGGKAGVGALAMGIGGGCVRGGPRVGKLPRFAPRAPATARPRSLPPPPG